MAAGSSWECCSLLVSKITRTCRWNSSLVRAGRWAMVSFLYGIWHVIWTQRLLEHLLAMAQKIHSCEVPFLLNWWKIPSSKYYKDSHIRLFWIFFGFFSLQCLKCDLEKVGIEKVTVSLMTQPFVFLLSTANCGSKLEVKCLSTRKCTENTNNFPRSHWTAVKWQQHSFTVDLGLICTSLLI